MFMWISLGPKFQFKITILIFWTKSTLKGKNRKTEHHHWILLIWFSLSTKFELKLTSFSSISSHFHTNMYFQSKTEKLLFSVCPRLLLTMLNFSAQCATDTTVFKMSFLLLVTETKRNDSNLKIKALDVYIINLYLVNWEICN